MWEVLLFFLSKDESCKVIVNKLFVSLNKLSIWKYKQEAESLCDISHRLPPTGFTVHCISKPHPS